jgi:hypothetical protein
MNEIDDLNERMKDIISNYCNKLGCGNCGLEWEENGKSVCSATELQGKILDIEMAEFK